MKVFCLSRVTAKLKLSFLYSNHIPTLLQYFFYVAQVFTKYMLLFKLSRNAFFLLHTGHLDLQIETLIIDSNYSIPEPHSSMASSVHRFRTILN